MKNFLLKTFQKQTVKSAIKVSLIVGLLLNFINQGVAICTLDVEHIDWLKLGLTFIVPFVVSVYSAVQAKKIINKEQEANE